MKTRIFGSKKWVMVATLLPSLLYGASLRADDHDHRPHGEPEPKETPLLPREREATSASDHDASRGRGHDDDHDDDHASFPIGSMKARLLEVGLDILASGGWSSARDNELKNLQSGGHDPRKRGFTLQQAEFFFAGALDPWLTAKAYLIAAIDPEEGETVLELEEAFITTRTLPFSVRAGHFFTDFGVVNRLHPHAWQWLDQPVIHSRLFGGDGMRGTGALLAWEPELSWKMRFAAGAQNAGGETMASFLGSEELYEEAAPGGRPFTARAAQSFSDLVWSLRLENVWDLSPRFSAALGASWLAGPNASGADAGTWIAGVDVTLAWWGGGEEDEPTVLFQAEMLSRTFRAAAGIDEQDPSIVGDEVALAGAKLKDYGGYAQVTARLAPHWSLGLRLESVDAKGPSYSADAAGFIARSADSGRDRRLRVSPLVQWSADEALRLRLQYNFDDTQHLADGEAHTLWFGMEVLFGGHRPHGPFTRSSHDH